MCTRISCFAFSTLLLLAACGDDDGLPGTDGGNAVTDGGARDSGTPAVDGGDECAGLTLCRPTEVFVDAGWLETHLDDADLQVVDIRGDSDFLAAHVPGAVQIDGTELRATVDGVPGQVVDAMAAQSVFRAAGLDRDSAIVVYGAATSTGPARLVWTLEYFGHRRVALLDGGYAAWSSTGATAESGAVTPTPSTYTVEIDETKRVDVEFIEPRLDQLTLVDARSTGEFTTGRLPGAINVDWNLNVDGGALRAMSEVDALYPGLDRGQTAVAYCQTGSRASVAFLVLRWLGFSDVRLYDGSWAEWGSRTDLPREPPLEP